MRIALCAMSGLRICDQAFLEAGLTFPALRRRMRQIETLPSLGLLTLAGLTPESADIDYFEILPGENYPALEDYDLVAVSCLTATATEAFALADHCRRLGTPTLLGGLYATLCPEEARRHFDSIAIGEGEPLWPQVIDDLGKGQLQKTYDARGLPPYDLALSPAPRYDLLPPRDYARTTVQSQRGCPFSCEFCAASIRLAPGFRSKPIDLVVRDIRAAKAHFRQPFIELADDNTFADKKHGLALAQAIGKEDVRWFAETDISVADEPDLLKAIQDAGCRQLLIGLESPTAAPLYGVEQKSDWKARRAPRYREAIDKIQGAGIAVNGCFVLGLDGQDATCFDEVFDFVQEAGLADVQVTYLTPFPGTPLHRRLSEEGRLLTEKIPDGCTLFDIAFQPDRMSVAELREGTLKLVEKLYQPGAVKERLKAFRSRKHGRPSPR